MGIRYAYIICFVSIAAGCFVFPNPFVAKKKEKVPSANQLKQDCCEIHTEIIQMVPQMMRAMADVQEQAFDVLEKYCRGESTCLAKASKQELDKYNKLLNNIAAICQNFTTEINAQLKAINDLKIV